MTQEEKDLLLKDLCARSPYDVQCCDFCYDDEGDIVNTVETLECIYPSTMKYKYKDVDTKHDIERIKPYLRPMSSMTEEEREDFWRNVLDMDWKEEVDYNDGDELETVPFPFEENYCGFYLDNYYLKDTFAVIDWLNSHHFDYRGLIEKGLAIEAPEGMYNTKTK